MPSIRLDAIKPGKLPTGQEYVTAMKKAAQKTADLTKRDLESTTRTWKHKPKFAVVVGENAAAYVVFAGTNDQIYRYVDEGTKPHDIKPKRSKFLRFSSGYTAKGKTGVIGSQPGGSSGDNVFSQGVHHPGFAGRHFTVLIAKRRQKTMEQEMSQALAKVARKQG
ncbi:MAG: hypothetical protein H0X30_01325 [Anaerolineae bacterium]|nr:hypothetical protein [Anaerolineae bacterium]